MNSSLRVAQNPRKKVRLFRKVQLEEDLHALHVEFFQICKAVAVGFAVMGFIGYFVKLIHIPMCVTFFYCGISVQ